MFDFDPGKNGQETRFDRAESADVTPGVDTKPDFDFNAVEGGVRSVSMALMQKAKGHEDPEINMH